MKAFTFKSLGKPSMFSVLVCRARCLSVLLKPAYVGLVLHLHHPLSLPQCSFLAQYCPLFGFHSCLQDTLVEEGTPGAENSPDYSRVLSSAISDLSVQFTTWLHEIWTGPKERVAGVKKGDSLSISTSKEINVSKFTPWTSLIYLSEAQRQKSVWVCYFWTVILTYCLCDLKKNWTSFWGRKQTGFQAFPIDTSQEWQEVHQPSLKCKHSL